MVSKKLVNVIFYGNVGLKRGILATLATGKIPLG